MNISVQKVQMLMKMRQQLLEARRKEREVEHIEIWHCCGDVDLEAWDDLEAWELEEENVRERVDIRVQQHINADNNW